MNKCQKCGAKATTQLELNDKNKGEKTVLILCDVCYKEEIICQECKQEIKTLEIKQTTKTDGSTVRVCEECDKKIQLVKEWVAKIKNLKQELEKYVEFGEHRLADGTVIRGATCNIKENLTKEQLLAFKELLETNLTDKKAPTAGGEFLGWKRGTPEIEEALKVAEGTGIRQPYCYWLGVKEKIEELEKQEHLSNQERERERERERGKIQPMKLPDLLMLNQQKTKPLTGMFH